MKKQNKDYLIIDRSKWRTASHGEGHTGLLNSEGYMCCLGFRCNQMGIQKEEILGYTCPSELSEYYNIPDLIYNGKDTNFCIKAMHINDGITLNDKEREKRIIDLFKTKNITVEFVGKYKK